MSRAHRVAEAAGLPALLLTRSDKGALAYLLVMSYVGDLQQKLNMVSFVDVSRWIDSFRFTRS